MTNALKVPDLPLSSSADICNNLYIHICEPSAKIAFRAIKRQMALFYLYIVIYIRPISLSLCVGIAAPKL